MLTSLIIEEFKKVAIAEDAHAMSKYMKYKFEFLGLKKKQREEKSKEFFKLNAIPEGEDLILLVKDLWNQPYRELHYLAMQLLEKPIKKNAFNDIDFLEYLVVNQSWWDSIDYIAANLIGKLLLKESSFQLTYPDKWISSENMWLRRTAILFQLKYKDKTDAERLFEYVLKTAQEKEFFIRKAQGWALREYAKTNPQLVLSFVEKNRDILSNLTIREALKHLNNK
jgi:3-methyladenine DNA glycosylase AlkD